MRFLIRPSVTMLCLPAVILGLGPGAIACPGAIAQERRIDDDTLALLQPLMGRHPFAAFRDLALGRDDTTRTAWTGKSVPDRIQFAVRTAALAGLCADDVLVAQGASSLVGEEHLDVADIERYQQAVTPLILGFRRLPPAPEKPADVNVLENLVEWDDYKHTVSRADVAALLTHTPRWESPFRVFYLQDLHRSLRPEHLPALCALTRHQDPQVRHQTFQTMVLLSQHTDQHHEAIARALLAWRGPVANADLAAAAAKDAKAYEPRKVELTAASTGFSPLLAAVLHRSFVAARTPKQPWPENWLVRWAARRVVRWDTHGTPTATDIDLLLRLLRAHRPAARRIALLGLRHVRNAPTSELEEFARRTEDTVERALCFAALAIHASSGANWRRELQRRALQDDAMMAAALEVMPKLMVDDWVARVVGSRGPESTTPDAIQQIHRMREAIDWQRFGPFQIADETLDALGRAIAAIADKLDAPRLRALIRTFPECRTSPVAAAYLASLRTGDDLRECELAFLEVYDAAALGRRLEGFLQEPDRKDPALDALMQLGAHEHGDAIARRWPFQKDHDLFVLARCGRSPAVRRFLAKRLEQLTLPDSDETPRADWFQPLTALAMADGLPERTCRSFGHELAVLPLRSLRDHWPAWRKSVLEGRATDAILGCLRIRPIEQARFRHLGLVDDPRIREFLEAVRSRPGANVQWAHGELVLAGDADSRAVMDVVNNRAYYGWADDLSGHVLNGGGRRSTAPYWISEVETNCCRRVAANKALEDLCGYDIFEIGDEALVTQHAGAARWWRRHSPRLVASRVAGRFVIGPR